jgi:hypothetical protein
MTEPKQTDDKVIEEWVNAFLNTDDIDELINRIEGAHLATLAERIGLDIVLSAQITKLRKLNFRSPSEIQAIKRDAVERGREEVAVWVTNHLHRSPSCSYNFCFGERTWKEQLEKWRIPKALKSELLKEGAR